MRRIVITLVGLGTLLCGSGVAMAHGYRGGYGHHGPVAHRPLYAPYRLGVGYAPRYYAPAYAPPVYGAGYGYGGGYGAYGAYPQVGLGINAGNFGLWYQQ